MTLKRTEIVRKTPLPHPARRHLVLPRAEAPFAAPPTAHFVPVKTVGSFVPQLTRKAFEKFGFSTATLITDWARIAGAELADYTVPDKLRWPRRPDAGLEDDGERRGATLILRVDPARALDVEYRTRQIMERINSYFGYRAVEAIRLVQAPLPSATQTAGAPARQELDRRAGSPVRQHMASHPPLTFSHKEAQGTPAPTDEALLAALARLGEGVRRRGRRSA